MAKEKRVSEKVKEKRRKKKIPKYNKRRKKGIRTTDSQPVSRLQDKAGVCDGYIHRCIYTEAWRLVGWLVGLLL